MTEAGDDWKVLTVPTGSSDDYTENKEIFSGAKEAAEEFFAETAENGSYEDAEGEEQDLTGGIVLVDNTGAVIYAAS